MLRCWQMTIGWVVDSQGTLHGRHWALENEQAQQGILAKLSNWRNLIACLRVHSESNNKVSNIYNSCMRSEGSIRCNWTIVTAMHELSRSHASMQTRLELLREQQQQWQQQQQRLSETTSVDDPRRELQDKQALTDEQPSRHRNCWNKRSSTMSNCRVSTSRANSTCANASSSCGSIVESQICVLAQSVSKVSCPSVRIS